MYVHIILSTANCKAHYAQRKIQPLLEEYFIDYDEKVEYYTGLPNYNVLMAVFRFLENHIPITDRNSLSKLQQLILTLIKLRLSLTNIKNLYT
jgi:hypothetical protein